MSRLKAKLPPRCIMTNAQKEAADIYVKEKTSENIGMLIPEFHNLMLIAAYDSKLKQQTVQRIADNYLSLMHEFSDDMVNDPKYAKKRIDDAMKQRKLEWVENENRSD